MDRRYFLKALTALWAGIIAPFSVRADINQPSSTGLAVPYNMRRLMARDDLLTLIQQGDEITVKLSSNGSLTNAVEVHWQGHRLGLPWECYELAWMLQQGVRVEGKVYDFITYESRTGKIEVALCYYMDPSLERIGLWHPKYEGWVNGQNA